MINYKATFLGNSAITFNSEIQKNSVEALSYLLDASESQEQKELLMKEVIKVLVKVIKHCNNKLDTSATELAIACASD